MQDVLQLPNVVKRFIDEKRGLNILDQVLCHHAIVGVLEVFLDTVFVWQRGFVVCKLHHSLDICCIIIFACHI